MRKAAGIIIFSRTEGDLFFLLLRNRTHGTWGFPKGHLQKRESLLQAAFRELKEETGIPLLRVSLHPGFLETSRYCFMENKEEMQKEASYFLGEVSERAFQPSEEHSGHLWGTPEQCMQRLQFDSLKQILHMAVEAAQKMPGFQTLSPQEAKDLLVSSSPRGERCVAHSIKVAEVAYRMALKIKEKGHAVDTDYVFAAGHLHDIGRARTQGHFHGWEGYLYLEERGLSALGRVCITHWLKGRERGEIEKDGQIPGEILDAIEKRMDLGEMTLEDKIISLADSLVMENQEVSLHTRYSDAMERYGDSSWMRRNLEISTELEKEIQELMCNEHGSDCSG